MILYFSGTGNSAYTAKKIGRILGDESLNLFERIKNKDYSPLESQRSWVIAVPSYGWQIPHVVRDWLQKTELKGSRDIYFVMTCGDGIGNAGHYLRKLCEEKQLVYKGCAKIVMPENYIAMFRVPETGEAKEIIRKAEPEILSAAESIKAGGFLAERKIGFADRLCSGIINMIFYRFFVSAKKFYTEDGCISCGKCVKACPLGNIKLAEGRPIWGKDCTHCMACICTCPVEVIEYGKKSRGKPRYFCPESGRE